MVRPLEDVTPSYLNPENALAVDRRLVDLVADQVVKRLPQGSLLELGAGFGVWTEKLLRARQGHVTTVEGVPDLLQAVENKIDKMPERPRWTPVLSMFEDFRPQKRFDVVLMSFVLDHLEDPGALLKLARESWMAPQGKLIVLVSNATSLHRRLAVLMGKAKHCGELGPGNHLMAHHYSFSVPEMERLVSESGFTLTGRAGLLCKLLPNAQLTSCSDEQLQAMVLLGAELPVEFAAIMIIEGRA
jgi:2-polyprenyl-3-methyl-5-hydroxy-6-metoxy-1,4-benzoquinol methylase